jgi:hypothetical protein
MLVWLVAVAVLSADIAGSPVAYARAADPVAHIRTDRPDFVHNMDTWSITSCLYFGIKKRPFRLIILLEPKWYKFTPPFFILSFSRL